ncbi:MAG: AmmeMemoRadiSam system protein B [Candidatus Chromulinivorax sp.]|nr:AmmeMemoRadiSam system protein B [Candidatus Chromulinivorax sp.]
MYLLLIVSFFFIIQLQEYACAQVLQYADEKSWRMYPVPKPQEQIRMIIVPHGQTEQSQCLMAATYRMLQDQTFDKLIFLCSTNATLFHGIAMPWALDNVTSMDIELIEKLSHQPLFHYYQQPFCNNIGMQLHLRFLDFYVHKNVHIIPLIVGQLSEDDIHVVVTELANYCGPQTLFVVCADVACHEHCFHDLPLDQSKICKVYDRDICRIQAIQAGSLEQHAVLFDNERNSSVFAVLFEMLRLPQFCNVTSDFVGYATSWSDQAKNMENITTYGAFIFQANRTGYKNNIGSYEQLELLQCARHALRGLFEVPVCRRPWMISYEMSQPHGVFVSLYTMSDHGIRLRGCMGKVQAKISLYDMVYHMSKQAACNDVRFYPLCTRDLDNTIISLSVITDCTRIRQYNQIGESDGVLLQYGGKEAVWEPTKLSVTDVDYQAILIRLSDQMGLHRFIWKKPKAHIFTFHSIVFQEE